MNRPLAPPALAANLAAHWRGSAQEVSAVQDQLATVYERVQAALAALGGDPGATLLAALATHAQPGALADYLSRCRAEELVLATMAARGHAAAIAEVEQRYAKVLTTVCRRFATPREPAEDLLQSLRGRWFVGEGDRAGRLADYSGQGSLEGFLRVTAVRWFLDLGKRKDRAREVLAGSTPVLEHAALGDLELSIIKAEHREQVTRALHRAASALAPGDRLLLRQHVVDGLTIDQLAAALGLHRATAARRVASARDKLASETRRELQRSLALDEQELGELLAQTMSQLEVSLRKLLASGAP